MSYMTSPFTATAPRPPHRLTGVTARVLPSARAASRGFIGKQILIKGEAASSVDGEERVMVTDGTSVCACRLIDLDVAPH